MSLCYGNKEKICVCEEIQKLTCKLIASESLNGRFVFCQLLSGILISMVKKMRS